jgi:chromosome segregation ATPase
LNEEKNKEIEKTWQIVSENCSKIFQILLPGAQAKLEIADK